MIFGYNFWENLTTGIIFLSVFHLVGEELSIVQDWSLNVRFYLLLIGFAFDLIFTLEFILRSIGARKKFGWKYYFFKEKGWIDFLCSIPILFFNSGPVIISMLFIGSSSTSIYFKIFNILKITKILRISRLLRLVRLLKIKYKVSVNELEDQLFQLNRGISVIILTIVIIMMVTPFFSGIFYSQLGNIEEQQSKYISGLKNGQARSTTFTKDKNIIYLSLNNKAIINRLGKSSKIPQKRISNKYLFTDYDYLEYKKYKLWYSVKDPLKENAKINLLIELIMLSQMITFVLLYKSKSAIKASKKTSIPDTSETSGIKEPEVPMEPELPFTPPAEDTGPPIQEQAPPIVEPVAPAAPEPLGLEPDMPPIPEAPMPEAPMPDVAPPIPEAAPPNADFDIPPIPEPGIPPMPEAPMPDVAPPIPEAVPPIPEAAPPIPEAVPPIPEAAPPIPEAVPPIPEAAPPIPEAVPPIPEAAPPIPEAAPPVPEAPMPGPGVVPEPEIAPPIPEPAPPIPEAAPPVPEAPKPEPPKEE